jgi:ankyrin repeat protein
LLLAADDVDPNVGDESSLTPLYWACKMGHVSIVKLLLARDDVSLEAIRCGPRFASCVPQVLGEELAMEV